MAARDRPQQTTATTASNAEENESLEQNLLAEMADGSVVVVVREAPMS